jgi:6-phosphogluconolactonase
MRRGLVSILLNVVVSAALAQGSAEQGQFLLAGTYTNTGNLYGNTRLDSSGSKGIYVYRFDPATGKTKLLSHTERVCNPSYLAIAPNGHHVYACTESRITGRGSVSAFDLDRSTGRLRFINKVSSGGDNPAYVTVDGSGRWLIVANYTGGSFAICGIGADGGLLPPAQRVEFSGHGVNPQRQEKSHVHSVVLSLDQKHLYIQDLGLDRITGLPFDAQASLPAGTGGLEAFGKIDGAQPERAARLLAATPGAGPRHLIFGPDGRFAYLIEEMGGMVDVYRYDPGSGRLDSVQRIAAHADTARGPFRSADIHMSPDGRFLYASNRLEANLAIFAVDQQSGRLRPIGYEPVFGVEPRNFTIDPGGDWLLVADQESGIIVTYRLDKNTGALTPLPERIKIPLPTYLRIMR